MPRSWSCGPPARRPRSSPRTWRSSVWTSRSSAVTASRAQEFIEGAGTRPRASRSRARCLAPRRTARAPRSYKVATDFIERYTEAYGKAPDTFAGHAYDGLYLIVEAMKRLDEGFTSADLRDEIESTSGSSASAGLFNFTADDHNGMSADDLVSYEVDEGAWTLLE